jgi:hypothetical protein
VGYKARIMAAYAEKSHPFSQVIDSSPDAGSDNASDHTFRGRCVDCIDLGIPRGYRTMIITHLKIEGAPAPKVGLPI